MTLILGAAGGAAATAALNDDEIIRLPSLSAPAAVQSTGGDTSPSVGQADHPSRLGTRVATPSTPDPSAKTRSGGPAAQIDSGSSSSGQNGFGARP